MSEVTVVPRGFTAPFRRFGLAAAMLTVLFAGPLWRLVWFSAPNDLYSYIPLMPAVCAYLAWTLRAESPVAAAPAPVAAGLFMTGGALALAGYFAWGGSAYPGPAENVLALSTLAWLFGLAGAGCWFLGSATMRRLAYPFGLMAFMIPCPAWLRDALETGLQHGSAAVAHGMFTLAGTPVWREDMVFRLPNITFQVAPECSGIHSTLVLLITSLVAGRMILRRPVNRLWLCLAVIPLALLRNGFRVFVIGELCVHVSPRMIDSPIHHHGGPLFFVLSLIPFFLLLYLLRKSEGQGVPGSQTAN